MGRCMYICTDLYMCVNTNVHVCPYINTYDAVVYIYFMTMYSTVRIALMLNCSI